MKQFAGDPTVLYSIEGSRQVTEDGTGLLFTRIAILDVLGHASNLVYRWSPHVKILLAS